MDPILDLDAAQAAVDAACAVVDRVREAEFWRLNGRQLLELGTGLERLSRLVFGAQVALAGEVDTQGVAADFGCVSTAALLRQALVISAPDAKNRVETARAVLPRDGVSGGEILPTLPLLGEALADGAIGIEQTRTIVSSMKRIPAHVNDETRELTQKLFVENGQLTEPKPFADFTRMVVDTLTCDGKPPRDEDCAARVELNLGVRNPDTGMTRFHGQLDDIGVEVMSQAIDGLSKPRPAVDGKPGAGTDAIGTGTKDPPVGGVPPRPGAGRGAPPVPGRGGATDSGWGTTACHGDHRPGRAPRRRRRRLHGFRRGDRRRDRADVGV